MTKKASSRRSLRNILGNTSWLVVERIVTMLTNLGVTVVVARSLGPETFGSLSYLLAIVGLVTPLCALGLNAIVTKELAENEGERHKVLSTSLAFRTLGALIGSLVCFALIMTGLGLDNRQDALVLALLALANLCTALQVFDFWFQYRVESKRVCQVRLLVVVSAAVAKVVAVWVSPNLVPVAIVYAIEIALIGLGYYVLYHVRQGPVFWRHVDWRYGWQLLSRSGWLLLSGLASVVYLKVDQVMLGEMVSREEVGAYAVAARLSEVWYFFPNALVLSFFPALLHFKHENPQVYQRRLQQLSDVLFVAALALAVAVTFLAGPVINLLFGPQYQASAPVLAIHIWAAVFIFMRALVSKWLLAENLFKFSLVSHGLGAVVNIAMNWFLIPLWGAKGAAVATLVSYAVASHFAMLVHPKTRPMAGIMNASLLLPLTLGARYWKSGAKLQIKN